MIEGLEDVTARTNVSSVHKSWRVVDVLFQSLAIRGNSLSLVSRKDCPIASSRESYNLTRCVTDLSY